MIEISHKTLTLRYHKLIKLVFETIPLTELFILTEYTFQRNSQRITNPEIGIYFNPTC